MHETIDVLGLGCTAVDDLLYVDAYPPADGKVAVRRHERQCGGLTATALVAAARLGCRCAFAGTLGDDDSSQFVLERFREEGIDVTYMCRRAEARPVRATIVIDQGRRTRAIFYDPSNVFGAAPTWPPEEVIRSARALLVDDYGAEGMIRAAKICRDAQIPVVADLEIGEHALFPKLFGLIDHLVLSQSFAQKMTGEQDPAAAARALWTPGRRAVVITCGIDGCWYVTDAQPEMPRHQSAIRVEAIDTTGCGDVFHGAYAAALAYGWDIATAVRFASAAAGLKATRRGGQAGIPTRAAVEAHMAKAFSNPAQCDIVNET